MPQRRRRPPQTIYRLRLLAPLSVCTAALIASCLVACGSESTQNDAAGGSPAPSAGASSGGNAGASAGSGTEGGGGSTSAASGTGTSINLGHGLGGASFNQCGVAAPLPAEAGQCTKVTVPLIANFDDSTGTDAASYSFRINSGVENSVSGVTQHVGDGSDANGGTSVVSTSMVTGEGGTGYALQFANTNAANWGGLLMLYIPGTATAQSCLDARSYGGIEFSIKGVSPSGRFGVSLSMLDTSPKADNGLCDNAPATDCKDPKLERTLPKDAETWTKVQVPWSSLTPGVGSLLSCVPVTGQNLVRLVIQPFMSYPPPDYTYKAGPYSITVDNISFY